MVLLGGELDGPADADRLNMDVRIIRVKRSLRHQIIISHKCRWRMVYPLIALSRSLTIHSRMLAEQFSN